MQVNRFQEPPQFNQKKTRRTMDTIKDSLVSILKNSLKKIKKKAESQRRRKKKRPPYSLRKACEHVLKNEWPWTKKIKKKHKRLLIRYNMLWK
jgi:hypothetical protein